MPKLALAAGLIAALLGDCAPPGAEADARRSAMTAMHVNPPVAFDRV